MGCGADTNANTLINSLTADATFDIPEIDLSDDIYKIPLDEDSPLYKAIPRLTNSDLTTRIVNGTGTFDVLMTAAKNHIKEEYEKGRITGAEYTKAYIATLEACMGSAVQFLLQKDAAYWNSQTAQINAITAMVQTELAKTQLIATQYEAYNHKASYALTKMRLSTEDSNYCAAQYTLDYMLPAQKKLVDEQTEVQRAQTLDTRSDSLPVVGVLGKQKDLYSQQITSYKRDSEVKAAKLFTDAWITQKTMDEGLLPPPSFANPNLDIILQNIQENNDLD